jgi:hypothetical protein
MEPSELLEYAAGKLDSLAIRYFTTGSMASILYGEPRLTNDVDIVVSITPANVNAFCAAFPGDDYYVSEDAIRDAIARYSQFNVIHPGSGLKIDFMVADNSEFNRERFKRTRSFALESGKRVHFASPEDVIVRKLEYFKEGGSEKHLSDIRGILKLCETPIDVEYIEQWATRLGVLAEWQLARER